MNNQIFNWSPGGNGTSPPTNRPEQTGATSPEENIGKPRRRNTGRGRSVPQEGYSSEVSNVMMPSFFKSSQRQFLESSSIEQPMAGAPATNETLLSYLLGQLSTSVVRHEMKLQPIDRQSTSQPSNLEQLFTGVRSLEKLYVAGWCYTRNEIDTLLSMPTKSQENQPKNLLNSLEALGSRIRDWDRHVLNVLISRNFSDKRTLTKFSQWAKNYPVASKWRARTSAERVALGSHSLSYEEFETLRNSPRPTGKLCSLEKVFKHYKIRNIIGHIIGGNEYVWKKLVEKGFSTFKELCAIRNWGKTHLTVLSIARLEKGKYYDENPTKSDLIIDTGDINRTAQWYESLSDVAFSDCPDPVHRDVTLDNHTWYQDYIRNVMDTVASDKYRAPLSSHFLLNAEQEHAKKLMEGKPQFITTMHKLGFISISELRAFYDWAQQYLIFFNNAPYKAPSIVGETLQELTMSELLPSAVLDELLNENYL